MRGVARSSCHCPASAVGTATASPTCKPLGPYAPWLELISHPLLNKPAGEAARPKALPIGDYPGVIRSWEAGDQNRNKTPYIRFSVSLTDWAETVDQSERVDKDGAPVDLSKKSYRSDFYMTEDAQQYRLDDLIRASGIDPTGQSYGAVLPHMVGRPVIVSMGQRYIEDTEETVNQVNRVVAAT